METTTTTTATVAATATATTTSAINWRIISCAQTVVRTGCLADQQTNCWLKFKNGNNLCAKNMKTQKRKHIVRVTKTFRQTRMTMEIFGNAHLQLSTCHLPRVGGRGNGSGSRRPMWFAHCTKTANQIVNFLYPCRGYTSFGQEFSTHLRNHLRPIK